MDDINTIIQGGAVGIAVGLIILIGYMVKCLLPVFKTFNDALNKNTKATTEMHEFMKTLNGRLRRAVKEKLDEKE